MGIVRGAVVAALAVAALAGAGCRKKEEPAKGAAFGSAEDAAAILRKIPPSPTGGPAGATQRVVKDAKEWESLWSQVTAHRTPASKAPAVDFGKEMVAFAALGSKPTGGWTVEVVGARTVDGKLDVIWAESGPPEGAAASQAMTSPWHAVVLARSDAEVTWTKRATLTLPPPKPRK